MKKGKSKKNLLEEEELDPVEVEDEE